MRINLTKTEKIMAILNQYDPMGEYARSNDYCCYCYEADSIAHNLRKNSRLETVFKAIVKVFPGIDTDSDGVQQMAVCILIAVK